MPSGRGRILSVAPYDRILLTDSDLKPFMSSGGGSLRINQVLALLAEQRGSWPQLSEGYAEFSSLETKEIRLGRSRLVVQFNPKRIRNTAKFDRKTAERRPCFLDAENLPPEERGLAYSDNFVITGNPFPVLADHITILHRRHISQALDNVLPEALKIAQDLQEHFFILYNGPEAGASAPDHAHLQGGSRSLLPIESEVADLESLRVAGGAEIILPEDLGRGFIVLRGSPESVGKLLPELVAKLPRTGEGREPLINVIFTSQGEISTVYLFPRTRFRPQAFFAEGNQQLLISPAALELAGIVVVPREEDFRKLTSEDILTIFAEVTLTPAQLRGILETL